MKLFIIDFLNYFYTNFIFEDWSDWTRTGKIFIYPFWLVRSIIYWCLSPLFLIGYGIGQIEFFQELKKGYKKLEKEHNIKYNR